MYKQYVRIKNVRRKQYYVIERRCGTFRHFRFRPFTSCLLRNRRRGKGVYSKRFGRGHHGFDTAAVTQTDPLEGSTDRVPEAEPLTPIFLRFPYRCCMLCDVMHRDNKLSPRGRQDDMPSPMAVRLAADLRPSADRSAVRTWLSCRQPACL